MIEHDFSESEELVIPVQGGPVLLTFRGSGESAEFHFEHTGEYDGGPDPFTWTTITALNMVPPDSIPEEDAKKMSGLFVPELLKMVADGQAFCYNPSSAKYLRLTVSNDSAKQYGVSVDVR